MSLPADVASLCRRFLELAPAGLVTGLYLRGGLAFGEWAPGHSDVDFVATMEHRPTDAEVDLLRAVHAELATYYDIRFDGMHVLACDLGADPRRLAPVPTVLEHTLELRQGDSFIAWHELALGGVTVLGPRIETLPVWTDTAALHAYTRENLDTYWRGWAERLPEIPAEADWDWITAWCALGSVRLDHLLATGRMTAKSIAGRWALAHYPERFAPALREALRLRGLPGDAFGPQYADPARRRREVAELTGYVVDHGHRAGQTESDIGP